VRESTKDGIKLSAYRV